VHAHSAPRFGCRDYEILGLQHQQRLAHGVRLIPSSRASSSSFRRRPARASLDDRSRINSVAPRWHFRTSACSLGSTRVTLATYLYAIRVQPAMVRGAGREEAPACRERRGHEPETLPACVRGERAQRGVQTPEIRDDVAATGNERQQVGGRALTPWLNLAETGDRRSLPRFGRTGRVRSRDRAASGRRRNCVVLQRDGINTALAAVRAAIRPPRVL